MAFTSLGSLGSSQSKVSASTIVLTTTATAEAGNLVVVVAASDNAGPADGDNAQFTSVTDSAGGNTWVEGKEHTNGQGATDGGAAVAIFFCVLTNQIASGGTISVSMTNGRIAKAITAWEFSKAAGTTVEVSGTPVVAAPDAALTGASMTLSGLAASTEFLAIRGEASESPFSAGAPVVFSSTANWTKFDNNGTSGQGATSNMQVGAEFRIQTATSFTSAPSGVAVGDNAAILLALREIASGTQFNQSCLGTTSPTRSLSGVPGKLARITSAPTPAVTRQVAKSALASTAPVETVARQSFRTLQLMAGSIAAALASRLFSASLSATGQASPSGSRATSKGAIASTAPLGTRGISLTRALTALASGVAGRALGLSVSSFVETAPVAISGTSAGVTLLTLQATSPLTEALGDEHLINGGFADETGWSHDSFVIIEDGKAHVTPGVTTSIIGTITQNLAPGLWELTYTLSDYVSGAVRPRTGPLWAANFGPDGTYTERKTLFSPGTFFWITFTTSASEYKIDDISLRPVLQFGGASLARSTLMAMAVNAGAEPSHVQAMNAIRLASAVAAGALAKAAAKISTANAGALARRTVALARSSWATAGSIASEARATFFALIAQATSPLTEALGDNYLVNGTMEDGTGWPNQGGLTFVDGKMVLENIQTSSITGDLVAPMEPGVWELTYTLSDYQSGSVRPRTNVFWSANFGPDGTYTERRTLPTQCTAFLLTFTTSIMAFKIDNLSIRPVLILGPASLARRALKALLGSAGGESSRQLAIGRSLPAASAPAGNLARASTRSPAAAAQAAPSLARGSAVDRRASTAPVGSTFSQVAVIRRAASAAAASIVRAVAAVRTASAAPIASRSNALSVARTASATGTPALSRTLTRQLIGVAAAAASLRVIATHYIAALAPGLAALVRQNAKSSEATTQPTGSTLRAVAIAGRANAPGSGALGRATHLPSPVSVIAAGQLALATAKRMLGLVDGEARLEKSTAHAIDADAEAAGSTQRDSARNAQAESSPAASTVRESVVALLASAEAGLAIMLATAKGVLGSAPAEGSIEKAAHRSDSTDAAAEASLNRSTGFSIWAVAGGVGSTIRTTLKIIGGQALVIAARAGFYKPVVPRERVARARSETRLARASPENRIAVATPDKPR